MATRVRDEVCGEGDARVEAYVVEPADGQVRAGILFLHWLGEHHSDRTQFLSEARGYAELGVRSALPAGRLPWVPDPVDAETDVANLGDRDFFIAPMSAIELTRATRATRPAGSEPRIEWYTADHAIRSAKARAARAMFLRAELGLR